MEDHGLLAQQSCADGGDLSPPLAELRSADSGPSARGGGGEDLVEVRHLFYDHSPVDGHVTEGVTT